MGRSSSNLHSGIKFINPCPYPVITKQSHAPSNFRKSNENGFPSILSITPSFLLLVRSLYPLPSVTCESLNTTPHHVKHEGPQRPQVIRVSASSQEVAGPIYSSSFTFSLASPAVFLAASEPALTCSRTHCQVFCSVSLSFAKTVSAGVLVPYRK